MEIVHIPHEVEERLGYYVYLLVDPRDGRAFYVGKGKGARVTSHQFEAWDMPRETHAKFAKIQDIRQAGLEPRHDIVRYGLSQEDAFMVEAALIDSLPGLTNKVRGQGVLSGRITLGELITQFAAPPLGQPPYRAMFIRLGNWHGGGWDDPEAALYEREGGGFKPGMSRKNLYEATRGCWKVSERRLRRDAITLAVPVHNGVTRAVYQIQEHLRRPIDGRWAFVGTELDQGPEFDAFVGPFGRLVPFAKGAQNPIVYYYPGEPVRIEDDNQG